MSSTETSSPSPRSSLDFDPVEYLSSCTISIHNSRKYSSTKLKEPVDRTASDKMLIPPPAIEALINGTPVQQAIPNLRPCLSPKKARSAEYMKEDYVKYLLHSMADELYQHTKLARIWQQSCRDGSNDLLWFLNRVNLEKPSSPASAVRTAAKRLASGGTCDDEDDQPLEAETAVFRPNPSDPEGPLMPFRRRVNPTKFDDLSYFEDLFYMIWHKIQVLYQDLQLRFANGFIKLDDVIHHRGVTLQKDENLTVGDFVLHLQAYWEELTDPRVIRSIDEALRRRIITDTLHPNYDPSKHTRADELEIRTAYLFRGLKPGRHSPGLRDISTVSPVEILNYVYSKNGIILDCEKQVEENHRTIRNATRTKTKLNTNEDSRVNAEGELLDPEDPRNYPCRCPGSCVCRDLCRVEPEGGCLCEMMPEFYDAYELDMLADEELEGKHGAAIGEHYLYGCPTNEYAQLHVAAHAYSADCTTVEERQKNTYLWRATRNIENAVRKLEWMFVRSKVAEPESESRPSTPLSDPEIQHYLQKPLPPTPTPVSPSDAPLRKRGAAGGSLRNKSKKAKTERGRS